MKREHLDSLWEHSACGGACLSPPYQPVPMAVWEDLVETGIIGKISTPDYVFPFDPDNEYGEVGRRCFYNRGSWTISGFVDDELEELHTEGKINLAYIDHDNLARIIAEQFGIKPVIWQIEDEDGTTDTCVIGWKGDDTAVVFTFFGTKNGSFVGFLRDIQWEIAEELDERFKEGYFDETTDEYEDRTDQPCPWTCKYLYVINIGGSHKRSAEQEERLNEYNITCLGTKDFLTDDGLPIWDAKVEPRPVLTYSEASMDFYCNGKRLNLKPTEMKILKVLQENQGKITTKEELFEAIWPKTRKPKRRPGAKRAAMPEWPEWNLDTQLSNLRKRLKQVEKLEIKTIRQKGYMLVVHQ